jgi:hypothetical protein
MVRAWGVGGVVAKVANIFDTIVARSVDLDHIQIASLGDLLAHVANSAGLRCGAVHAIERLRQDAGGRGFSNAARADKKIGLSQAACIDGVLKCPRDMILPDNLGEGLGTILAGKNSVTHSVNTKGARPTHPVSFFKGLSSERKNP